MTSVVAGIALTIINRSTPHRQKEPRFTTPPSISFEGLEKKFPIRIDDPIWKNYVVRKEGWGESYSTKVGQDVYGGMMHQSVQIGVHGVTELGWTFKQLFQFLACRRCQIAIEMGTVDAEKYGWKRGKIGQKLTYLGGGTGFGDLWKSIKEMHDHAEEYTDFYSLETGEKLGQDMPLPAIFPEKIISGHFHAQLEGEEEIELESVVFYPIDDITKIETTLPWWVLECFESAYVEELKSAVFIIHTPHESIEKILSYVEKLYHTALKKKDPKEIRPLLGEIFWWVCRANPWRRGDPSIAEKLIKTIYGIHGHQLPPWKKGIIPWCEVMKQPNPKQFAQDFDLLFCHQPK